MERKRMMSKEKATKKIVDGSGNATLLHEIEAISKAMYLDQITSGTFIFRANSRSKATGKSQLPAPKSKLDVITEDIRPKDKKSIWNWKPLKALSTLRNRSFNCCFSLQVQWIEGLPREFDDLSLCVFWKRRDGVLVTRSAKVHEGIAVFEQSLVYSCSVYGSRNGPHHSAKYEAKQFLLYASVVGAPELDLGSHRVDVTRLLPLTSEELGDEKSSGKWTTSFRLSGKAKGALMNVSFGYLAVGDKFHRDSSVEDVKDLHEVLPVSRSELASALEILYEKLDDSNLGDPTEHNPEFDAFRKKCEPVKEDVCDSGKEDTKDFESNGFSVIDQGIELSSEETFEFEKLVIKSADVSFTEKAPSIEADSSMKLISQNSSSKDETVVGDSDGVCAAESLPKELESALSTLTHLESTASIFPNEENNMDATSELITSILQKSNSLDDDTESVASEFLSMLGIEHSPFRLSSESEPESPRGRLLREFEKETLTEGFSLFDVDMYDENEIEDGFHMPASPGSEDYSKDLEDIRGKTMQQVRQDATSHRECSRWLIANGMGKGNKLKHPSMKAKDEERGETIWSISAPSHTKLQCRFPK